MFDFLWCCLREGPAACHADITLFHSSSCQPYGASTQLHHWAFFKVYPRVNCIYILKTSNFKKVAEVSPETVGTKQKPWRGSDAALKRMEMTETSDRNLVKNITFQPITNSLVEAVFKTRPIITLEQTESYPKYILLFFPISYKWCVSLQSVFQRILSVFRLQFYLPGNH